MMRRLHPLLTVLAVMTYGLWVEAKPVDEPKILPDSKTPLKLEKEKTIHLTDKEALANQEWAFMWHWLNNPNHEEYRQQLIHHYPQFTYKDGGQIKIKRPL